MIPRRTPVPVELPPHGVFVWESHHDHGFRMPPERHPFAELFYVLDGSGVFHLDAAAHPCRAGDVVVAPPGTRHQIEDGDHPLTLYGIGVATHLLAADPAALAGLPAGRLATPGPASDRVRSGLRRLLFEQTSTRPGGRTLVVGLALQLVAELVRVGVTPPPRENTDHARVVGRFLAELADRFYEPVDTDRAAAELGLSRRSFTRLFRRAAGCSYAKYVERVRIDYACRLLRQTGRSVTTIAFECGFEDLSSFYRAFKRRKGAPPRQWRQGISD
jgi:AraC family L-rhamnose operon regulatory protein RhaS